MDVYGRYELLEEIGRGGMAEVYLARLAGPLSISRFLALKRVLSDVSREIEVREMFVDEARLAMMLTHPNIVATYEFGEEERCYFLAMELVAGQDLRRVMRRCVERKRHVPADCACYIVAQVARALAYAHKLTDAQGKPLAIVHRDVTPSNVIISYDGAVKLTDFGVARAASRLRTNFTKVGELRGTPRYMSPEQAAGGALDSRSDLFSLTTILLELNVLHPAFHAKNEADSLRMVRGAHAPERDKYASEIPEDIARVVDKGMALDPQARFRDGDEMAEALELALRRRSPGFGPTNLAGFMSSLFAEDRGLWLDRMKLYDTRTIVDATRHPPTDPKLTAPLPSAVGTRPGVALPAEVEAPDTDEMPASAEPRTTDEMLAAAEARSTDKMPAAPDLAAVEVRTVTGKRQGTTGPETPSSAAKSPSDPPTAAHKLSAVKRTPSGPTPMSPAEPAAVHVPSEMTRRSLAAETVVTLPGEKTDRVPPPREFPVWLASALVALTVFVVMVRLLAPRASSAHDGTSAPPAAPSGVTTAPSGVTTAPSGATTAPSGATTAPSGATTAPSGATTAPSGAAALPTTDSPSTADGHHRMGVLVLQSMPWSEVSVDGHVVGNTPLMNLKVRAGRHKLVFKNPGCQPLSMTVHVDPTKPVERNVVLQRN